MAKITVRLFTNPAYTTPNVVGSVVTTTVPPNNKPAAQVLVATTLQTNNAAQFDGVGYNVVVATPSHCHSIKAIKQRYNQRFGRQQRNAALVKNAFFVFSGILLGIAVALCG